MPLPLDQSAQERQSYLDILGIADDPNLSLNDLKIMTGGGARVDIAANQAGKKVFDALTDASFTSFINNVASTTRSALQALFLRKSFIAAVSVKDYGAVGDGVTNDRTAFVNALASGAKVILLAAGETYNIAGTITVPAGITITCIGGKATVKQVTNNTLLFDVNGVSGVSFSNIKFQGVGSDYVANTTLAAIGVRCTAGASKVDFNNCEFFDFAGSGIRCESNVTTLRVRRTRIEGTGARGNITAGDFQQFGIYVGGSCSDIQVDDCEISECVQGIISSFDTLKQRYTNLKVYNIRGQHGLYLQNGNDLVVDNVKFINTNFNGMKVQLSPSQTADSVCLSITNVVGDGCGDTVVVLTNTSISGTDAAFQYKCKNVLISNVLATNGARALYIDCVRDATISNIESYNMSADAITLLDVWDTLLSNFNIRECGKNAIRFTSRTGGITKRIKIEKGKIFNAGNSNVAGEKNSIYLADAGTSEITLANIEVGANNGFMQYGLFSSVGDQKTLRVRNCTFKNGTGFVDVRLQATDIEEFSNVTITSGATVQNYPTTTTRVGANGSAGMYTGIAIPTSGYWVRGAEIKNINPAVGSPKAWLNTATGGSHNGLWAATTAYAVGDWRRTSTGRVLECTVAGTSGSVEPAPAAQGDVLTDGTVTWVCRAMGLANWVSTGNL